MFIDTSLRRARMLREWRSWARRIAMAAEKLLPGPVEVYVIGSTVRGDYVAASDVDILIISPGIPDKPAERARIKVLMEEELRLPYYHPFQIHLARPEEAALYLGKAGKAAIKIT